MGGSRARKRQMYGGKLKSVSGRQLHILLAGLTTLCHISHVRDRPRHEIHAMSIPLSEFPRRSLPAPDRQIESRDRGPAGSGPLRRFSRCLSGGP